MSDKLTIQLQKMERQYETLRRDFSADGHVSTMEQLVLDTVGTKLQTLRAQVVQVTAPATSGRGAGSAQGEVTLGGASIQEVALGPAVPGPRIGKLMAFVAEDGSGPLNRSNSKGGAHVNETGAAALKEFHRLQQSQDRWHELYSEVDRVSEHSAAGLKKMQEASRAVGKRSKNRSGEYVREHSEEYIKGQRAVEDKLRAIGPLQSALAKALSEMKEAGLGKDVTRAERHVDDVKEEVEKEKKEVEQAKKRLEGLFGLAISAVKQDWAGLAEDAVKLIGGELIDAMPTGRLDQLKKKLEQATADLERIEDKLVMARIETAARGIQEAAGKLEDAREDIVAAIKDLKLAQKTAVEALGESSSTAPAAKMIALRGKMHALMERGRQAVTRYLRQARPFLKDLDKLDSLYSSFPGVVKMTPGIDLQGEYAKALISTANENLAAIRVWKSYVTENQESAQAALGDLTDTGDDGFLKHFNRVPEVLEAAIRDR